MKLLKDLKKSLVELGDVTYNTITDALDSVNPSPLHRRILLSCLTTTQASTYGLKNFVIIFKFANACLRLHNITGKLPNRLKCNDVIFTIPVCPKCKKSEAYEMKFWDLYNTGVPICTNCDEDIWVNDDVTIRKGG